VPAEKPRRGERTPFALRQRAEALLARGEVPCAQAADPKGAALIHELRVHQAELELQNEELRRIHQDLEAAKRALEESRDRYRTLYEIGPIGHLTLRHDGMILTANPAALALLDVAEGRLRRLAGFVAPSDRGRFKEFQRALFTGAGRESCEVEVQTAGGAVRRVRMDGATTASPLLAGEALLSLVDLTDLREAEDELRASSATLQGTLDASPDGIVTTDESGTIVSANPAVTRLFGYAPEELIGSDVSRLMPSPWREEHAGYLARYLRTGERRMIGLAREVSGCRKDGVRLPLRLALGEVRLAGKRLFVGFLHDLRDEERLDLQLRAMALDATLAESRERRRLAEDLHDGLGQLLALARMKLGQLRSDPELGASEARVREVESLIADAHAEASSLTFRLGPPELEDAGFIEAVRWLAEDVGQRFGLQIEVHDDGLPKPLAEAAHITLLRSLRELLVNVSKHARTGHARVTLRRGDGMVWVSVEDEGVGFDPEAASRGYGLFSTRQRLHHLGGSVRIESVQGDGTRIHLGVPVPTAGGEA
jgi:PAS domain S-box-containing protein